MVSKAAAPSTGVLDMELQPKPEPAALPATVDPLIEMIQRVVLDPSADIGKLERLEQMYERAQMRKAEQAFNQAMAAAQSEMQTVAPDLHNKQTHSDYASYAALDRMARPIYTKHGLALSFNSQESKTPEHVLVLCYVTHIGGYTRTYQADMPADGKGAKGGDVMTKTHATGSAFSYAQRYLLRLIFNLAVGEDDDGNAAGDTEATKEPEGFTTWIEEMREASMLGAKALTDKWQKSDNIFKNFILVKDWEAMKQAAKLADKAAERA